MDMTPLQVSCWRGKFLRRTKSGTPSTIIYTRRSSRRNELGCDAPVAPTQLVCGVSVGRCPWSGACLTKSYKQRVLMHGHQGWNVRHGLCHIYMRYVYIYIWVVYSLCFFCCLFITVTWWYVWCFEWASDNQEEVQACLVTLWLFVISCYSLYKTTLGLLCSWF